MNTKARELEPGELAFMESVLEASGGEITRGTIFLFDHTESCVVSGLEKKGLILRQHAEGEVEATVRRGLVHQRGPSPHRKLTRKRND